METTQHTQTEQAIMAAKHTYTATVADGTVFTRTTHRIYTHCISAQDLRGGVYVTLQLGWAGSPVLAAKRVAGHEKAGFLNVQAVPCTIMLKSGQRTSRQVSKAVKATKERAMKTVSKKTTKATKVKATKAKATSTKKKAASNGEHGVARSSDLLWTEKKVALFQALKAMRATTPGKAVSGKAVAAKAGINTRDVRHYSYHAKATGLVEVVTVENIRGYGFYLTAAGAKVNPAAELKAAKASKPSKKAAPKAKKATKKTKKATKVVTKGLADMLKFEEV